MTSNNKNSPSQLLPLFSLMHNTFVIGDIHGGLAALKQVRERAPIKPEDTLIFLSDYVDGWPGPFGVIEFLK